MYHEDSWGLIFSAPGQRIKVHKHERANRHQPVVRRDFSGYVMGLVDIMVIADIMRKYEKIPGQNGIGCFLKLPSTAAVVNYDLPKSVNGNQLAEGLCQSLQRNGPILKTLGKIMVAEGSFYPNPIQACWHYKGAEFIGNSFWGGIFGGVCRLRSFIFRWFSLFFSMDFIDFDGFHGLRKSSSTLFHCFHRFVNLFSDYSIVFIVSFPLFS